MRPRGHVGGLCHRGHRRHIVSAGGACAGEVEGWWLTLALFIENLNREHLGYFDDECDLLLLLLLLLQLLLFVGVDVIDGVVAVAVCCCCYCCFW